MHTIAWWPTLVAMVVSTGTDIRSRKIPNWLVVPFLLAGIAVCSWQDGWKGAERSLLGVGLGLLIFGVLSFLGGMGMGDVKLVAAVGAWVGPMQLGVALILTALVGGVMAIGWAVYAGFVKEMLKGAGSLVFGFMKRGLKPHPELVLTNPRSRKMPYGPAIAIGTLLSFLAG